MSYWEAIILGMLQGLTEFLPISSSGHIALAATLLELDTSAASQLQFTIWLHFATALSTLVLFWRRIGRLFQGLLQWHFGEEHLYVVYLLLSAVPAALVGLLLRTQIEDFFEGQLARVGGGLLLTALLLFWGYRKSQKMPGSSSLSWGKVLLIGLFQALALLPGVSRSGATISVALALRVSRREAAEFSFLMALIPIFGGSILDLISLLRENEEATAVLSLTTILAVIAAFFSGLWACERMIRWVRSGHFVYFSMYCLVVGLLSILLGV